MKEVAIALTSLLICACASSPRSRFFILDPVAPASDVPQTPARPVQIVSVRLPAALDRRQMVREEVPNELTISEQDRWGAPLPDMTQRVLSQNLLLRLSAGRMVLPDQPAPAGTSAISVEVLQFGMYAAGTIVLNGSWSIVPSGTDVAGASYRFQLTQHAVAEDYGEQARVMSVLLGQLADSIAYELRSQSSD